MRIVRQYVDVIEFREDLNKQSGLGWFLESWQAVPGIANVSGYIVIAVYKGKL